MKTFLLIMMLFCDFLLESYSLSTNDFIQRGTFVNKVNGYIFFFDTKNSDGEYPLYNLKAIELRTNKQIQIASNLPCINCIKISDSIIAYTNGKKIFFWNLISKGESNLLSSDQGCKIIGLEIDSKRENLLEIQVDYNRKISFVKVINMRTKSTIFRKEINLITNEIEGVAPIIHSINNSFIFLLQDKLYSILLNNKPELRLISSRCDQYAVDNQGIVYYKFVTDEKTEGYYLDFQNWATNKVDQSLNTKIFNCEQSFLLTTTYENTITPYYIICGVPYAFSNNQWKLEANVVIFNDKHVEIRLDKTNTNKIDVSKFVYKFLN